MIFIQTIEEHTSDIFNYVMEIKVKCVMQLDINSEYNSGDLDGFHNWIDETAICIQESGIIIQELLNNNELFINEHAVHEVNEIACPLGRTRSVFGSATESGSEACSRSSTEWTVNGHDSRSSQGTADIENIQELIEYVDEIIEYAEEIRIICEEKASDSQERCLYQIMYMLNTIKTLRQIDEHNNVNNNRLCIPVQ